MHKQDNYYFIYTRSQEAITKDRHRPKQSADQLSAQVFMT